MSKYLYILFGVFLLSIGVVVLFNTAFAQSVEADLIIDTESLASTSLDLSSSSPAVVFSLRVKTDLEVVTEFSERIVRTDILLSKYAQELDTLRSRCSK